MSVFRVLETPLVVEEAIRAVSAPDVGGIDLFLGAVRDHNDGRAVTRLEYHAYVSMAEKEMQRIAHDIALEIPGVKLAALHRVGSLAVGDLAVVCAAGAAHRDEAFRACRALIDRIKHSVPIWKREHGPDGPYWVGWQDARCGDDHVDHDHNGDHDHQQ
jgi:molybdopterin synthase catalytic subunit